MLLHLHAHSHCTRSLSKTSNTTTWASFARSLEKLHTSDPNNRTVAQTDGQLDAQIDRCRVENERQSENHVLLHLHAHSCYTTTFEQLKHRHLSLGYLSPARQAPK